MCWQAAGAIHTDFERGFICAEVMHYDELHELGSEAAVKAAGKYRQEVRTCKLSSQSQLFADASFQLSGRAGSPELFKCTGEALGSARKGLTCAKI